VVHRVLIRGLPDLVSWVLGRRARFRVSGASMAPTLAPGDQILVDLGAYRRAAPQPGEIVLARHPYRTDVRMVKRVAAVGPDGRCALAGDNPAESADSRSFGWVPAALVLGRVVLRLG
jgi:nickel-type superoxide dismutase maturation protease